MDPFQMALDVMFHAPGSSAAIYSEPDAAPIAIRVIQSRPHERDRFGRVSVYPTGDQFEVRRSEVLQPLIGATLSVDDVTFTIIDEPLSDVEGLSWAFLTEHGA